MARTTLRLVTRAPMALKPASASRVFEELLADHLDALYRTALRLCRGNAADAQDLLQDAALRAFQAWATLRDPAAAKAWFFTILTRAHFNRERGRQRQGEMAASELEPEAFEAALAAWTPSPTPLDILERHQLSERIAEALDALAPELRAVVVLADVEGFRQREIAVMLELPEGTIASRLFRARVQLRTTLALSAEHAGWPRRVR